MKHQQIKNSASFLLLVFGIVLCGCTQSRQGIKQTITVTIEPLRYFTEAIVGDKFEVNTMVPKDGNPETYEPTVQQMMALGGSDLYIKVGSIGFEHTWMNKLQDNAPHTIIVDSSEGIVPRESSEGINDPHTWMSCQNAVIIARNIYRALAQINKQDSLYFKANLEALITKIRDTDTAIREKLTKEKSTAFLIYHPVLTYFAKEYGLKQIHIEDEGREPSALQLAYTIGEAKKCRVKVLFLQKEFANSNSEIVAHAVGTQVVNINPLSYHWADQMIFIAKSLQ